MPNEKRQKQPQKQTLATKSVGMTAPATILSPAIGASWDYIDAFREAGAPEPKDSHETAAVMSQLRKTFGDDAMALPPALLERLLNTAPWTYSWLRWLAQSIRRLEAADGFSGLRDRLVKPEKYDEALSVLQVAGRLLGVGFDVRLDVPTPVEGKKKVPDIALKDAETNVNFHCEISVLYSPRGQVDQSRALNCLVAPLLFQEGERVVFSGGLLRPISEDEIEGLRGRIQWEVWETRKEQSFREVNVEGILTLALAPAQDTDRVAEWGHERGLSPNSFCGVSPGADGYARLRLKVEEKAKQLPPGKPNVLVIHAHELFLRAAGPEELLAQCRESISGYDQIAMLVLVSEEFDGEFGGPRLHHLVVGNQRCFAPLPERTRAKLQRAFSS
jgi:hypothetical protein